MTREVEQKMVEYTFHCAEIRGKAESKAIPEARLQAFVALVGRIRAEILPHSVIQNNAYTKWFMTGAPDRREVEHFLRQFSVFSNLFLEAQLKKVINAPTLEAMRASKEILLNELGVVFRNRQSQSQSPVKPESPVKAESQSSDVDDALVEQEGSVEGGTFRFAAAHFEWLLRMTGHLGLGFGDVGKRRHGTPSTLYFCDELARLYGSEDPHTALGASFAVENWAAAGFWKELIAGLRIFKARECPDLPLSFFLWHDRVEDQHAAHTWAELEEEFFAMDLDQEKFIAGGRAMLDGVAAFWHGLDQDRHQASR
ncbi:MAG: hypothetical protein IPK13_01445 [Deltaproteobacteria bacterium]|nr:hypothetical protein [Deltaproteobacteria bacterium]